MSEPHDAKRFSAVLSNMGYDRVFVLRIERIILAISLTILVRYYRNIYLKMVLKMFGVFRRTNTIMAANVINSCPIASIVN